MATRWTQGLAPSQWKEERGAGEGSTAAGSYGREVEAASGRIKQYLLERVPKFQALTEIREEGWKRLEGDRYFARQRQNADATSDKQDEFFFKMMKNIGREIHRATGVFHITTAPLGSRPRVLDLCLAPGGFSSIAMQHSPEAHVRGFSLPPGEGGHRVRIGPHPNIAIDFLDVNMLAADMGADAVPPPAHPDADNFLPRRLRPGDAFDLVICDGQVLRTHPRASYREAHEAARLGFAQLALGLDSVRRGGTVLVLMHKVESWRSVLVLRAFCRFSDVRVVKPRVAHAKRSSCYMVASDVQPQREEARRAVDTWKRLWRAATFGSDEEYDDLSRACAPDVGQVLEDFGPTLIGLGAEAWEIQASALSRAPFLRQQRKPRPSPGGAVTE